MRWEGFWSSVSRPVFVGAVCVSVMLFALIAVLQWQSSRVAAEQVVAAHLQGNYSWASNLPWQADEDASGARAELAALRVDLDRDLASVTPRMPQGRAEQLEAASDDYLETVSGQLELVAGGGSAAAVRLSPFVTNRRLAVKTTVAELQVELANRGRLTRRMTLVGSALAVTLVCGFLLRVIRRLDGQKRAASELLVENGRLLARTRFEASTDQLTGLGNRRQLIDDFSDFLDSDLQPKGRLALALFDLDGFKAYNDRFGHTAGDALLTRLGERLRDAAFEHGHSRAYRIGGDEFVVLLRPEESHLAVVVQLAESALSERGEGFTISCSFGIAMLPDEAQTLDSALALADTRMYATKNARFGSAGSQTRAALVQLLFEHDRLLGDHQGNVTYLAQQVAESYGLSDHAVSDITSAAELHDIGKIAIPAEILNKPGPLTDTEWRFVHGHTLIGERIMAAAPSLQQASRLVRSSHERWDGTGYPDQLRGDRIPLGSRIIAVCDSYDAMVTTRPYKKAVSVEHALAELQRCAGTQFDPDVVQRFSEARLRTSHDTTTVIAA